MVESHNEFSVPNVLDGVVPMLFGRQQAPDIAVHWRPLAGRLGTPTLLSASKPWRQTREV